MNELIESILIGLYLSIICWSFYMLIRNSMIFESRERIAYDIFRKNNYMKYLRKYDRVTYGHMLCKQYLKPVSQVEEHVRMFVFGVDKK